MSDSNVIGALEHAHDAAARGEWHEAFDLLVDIETNRGLSSDDLALLAEVSYAAGHLDVAITAWERVHTQSVEAGERVVAAGAAARIAMLLLFDTALLAPARGWLARAGRLLEGQAEGPADAWHAVGRTYERLLGGDLPGALSWARRAVDVGSRSDPAAYAIGRVAEARVLILEGDVEQGVSLLEDVGVATVSGELDPLSTGVVYCELVCAFQGLAQYDLAEQWTEAMERWCQTNAIGSLSGRCRVHRAEILRLRGAYGEAETEAMAAYDELRPYLRRELGWPLSELGQIRFRRGDLVGAERALLAAHEAGWDPQPALSLLRLVQGDVASAAASIREALEHPVPVPSKERPPNNSLRRAPLLEAQVEIAVAAGDIDRARSAAEELGAIADRFHSTALVAGAALARGRVRVAEGDAADAELHLSDAVQLWNEIGAPYEAALAREVLADAHRLAGDDGRAALELRAARRVLDRIGDGHPQRATTLSDGEMLSERSGWEQGEFRREGDYWSLAFDGETTRVRDLKGMRYLARLLADPGREVHVLDLAMIESGESRHRGHDRSTAPGNVLGDAGEMLDDQAKSAYRRRLTEIEADIEEARALNDIGRIEQAEVEKDFLVRELSRAFGLGGRRRRAGSASERARAAVTRALRHAISRIGEHHPQLGEHLDRSIHTGTYCSYRPDAPAPPEWRLS